MESGYDPGMDQVLYQLIRSFFVERPVRAKSIVKWDLNVVLKYLKQGALGPTALLSIKDLTP